LPEREDKADTRSRVANHAGFSLHAGVAATQRDKLERLCRYVNWPAVSEKRLAITAHGQVRYQLKTPYPKGATHVLFEPPDFIARPLLPGLPLWRPGHESISPVSTVSLRRIASIVFR